MSRRLTKEETDLVASLTINRTPIDVTETPDEPDDYKHDAAFIREEKNPRVKIENEPYVEHMDTLSKTVRTIAPYIYGKQENKRGTVVRTSIVDSTSTSTSTRTRTQSVPPLPLKRPAPTPVPTKKGLPWVSMLLFSIVCWFVIDRFAPPANEIKTNFINKLVKNEKWWTIWTENIEKHNDAIKAEVEGIYRTGLSTCNNNKDQSIKMCTNESEERKRRQLAKRDEIVKILTGLDGLALELSLSFKSMTMDHFRNSSSVDASMPLYCTNIDSVHSGCVRQVTIQIDELKTRELKFLNDEYYTMIVDDRMNKDVKEVYRKTESAIHMNLPTELAEEKERQAREDSNRIYTVTNRALDVIKYTSTCVVIVFIVVFLKNRCK